jgi:hypothetical protein
MTPDGPLAGFPEVTWVATGSLLAPSQLGETGPAVAAALGALAEVGQALGLTRLEVVLVRTPARATVAALRGEELLVAEVDALKGTSRVERALEVWVGGQVPPPARSPQPRPRPAPSGPRAEAVFSGSLEVFELPDLLEFLRSARRTGVLQLTTQARVGLLRFREGWITAASSPSTPGIGELLARSGALGADDARALGASPGALDSGRGQRLVARGLVTTATLQHALRKQIEHTVRELLRWRDGDFTFSRDGDGLADPGEEPVQVDVQAVLLEVFREQDEAAPGRGAPH